MLCFKEFIHSIVLFLLLFQAFGAESKLVHKIKLNNLIPGEGGLSGLHIEDLGEDRFIVWTLTDRGPNGEKTDSNGDGIFERVFYYPEYTPRIFQFYLNLSNENGVDISLERVSVFRDSRFYFTGLPNQPSVLGKMTFDEIPLTQNGKVLFYDPLGIDPESITLANEFLWVGEEYGPSLLKVRKNGEVLKRVVPNLSEINLSFYQRAGVPELPGELAKRRLNRGFEGIAFDQSQDILILILQSPMQEELSSRIVKAVVFDLETEKTLGVINYPLGHKTKKVGGAFIENGNLFVLEQTKRKHKKVFKSPIGNLRNWLKRNPNSSNFPFDKKSLFLDLTRFGLGRFEKLEGLSKTKDFTFLINDNDFSGSFYQELVDSRSRSQKDTDNYLFIISNN